MLKKDKIIYLFSGIDYNLGFNKQQSYYLKKDISSNLTVTFIATSFDDYEKNDNIVKQTIHFFKRIDIIFKQFYLLDNRINKLESKKIVEQSDIVYLLGGSPEIQMNLINFYDLKGLLKNRNGITIGVSAGSMNQANCVVYKDEYQNNKIFDYEGIGLTEMLIYPHMNTNSIEYLNEILEVSKKTRIYALPNDSFIRIKNDSVQFIGDYYVLGE